MASIREFERKTKIGSKTYSLEALTPSLEGSVIEELPNRGLDRAILKELDPDESLKIK